jgi:cholesterol oxidase
MLVPPVVQQLGIFDLLAPPLRQRAFVLWRIAMNNNEFDAVVIGSGFGGGTVALRLAQAGKQVCVLERGRRWRGANLKPAPDDPESTPFPQLGERHFFWGRQLWRPDRQRLGLFELRQMRNLQGLLGAGVGGGSLIWANVVIEAPDWIFAENWPREITSASLQKYYRLADRFLRPAQVPGVPGVPDPLHGRRVLRADALKQAAELAGGKWSPVKIAVNFGNETQASANGFGRARQLGCNYCGLCSAGCPQNAKNTVDVSYIAEAEALGAEVRPLSAVYDIEPCQDGGYAVHFRRYTLDGRVVETSTIKGRVVVLAAGTFGSTELLLRAKQSGKLSDLSSALGSRFSVNGNVLGGAVNRQQPDTARNRAAMNYGPAIGSMIDFGDHVVEDFANPTWSAGIVGGTNWKRIVSFLMAWAGRKPSAELLARQAQDMLVYVGVGADRARGRLYLNPLGGLSLAWPGGVNNEPVVKRLHESMAGIAASLGRVYSPNVFSTFGRAFTYHPLGGCPMGESEKDGVVSPDGEVFGYPGLYIADGSIVPTAIGRNPSYTIAALAERVAEAILS